MLRANRIRDLGMCWYASHSSQVPYLNVHGENFSFIRFL
jgi:hypothetical protein